MIKAVTKDGTTKVVVRGDDAMLCADTCAIVHAVWAAITENDKTSGQAYEKFMREKFAAFVFDEESEPKPEFEDAKQEQGEDESAKFLADALIAMIVGSKS